MKWNVVGRWVGALAMVAVFASAASAQGPGGRGRGFGGPGGMGGRGAAGVLGLLSQEAVQKELGLSAETIEKGKKLVEEAGESMRAEMQKVVGEGGFRDLSDEQRREMQTKLAAATQALQAKYAPQVKALLTEEQFTRLQQIAWQAAGASALVDADLSKQLGLSKEQTDKVEAVIAESRTKQGELMREAFANRQGGEGGQRGDFMTKIQELNKERDTKALDVLTADQKAAFEKAKGKAFDVSQLQMGRGPGGPGGPGGRPGAGGRPGGAGRPAAGN